MTLGTRIDESVERFKRQPFGLLFVVAPWLLGSAVFIYQGVTFLLAASRQNTVAGIVTAVERGNRCYYKFSLGQEVYTGWETPLYDRRVPIQGEQVSVYYDPLDPGRSAMTDFYQKSLDAFGPAPLMLLISAAGIFLIFRQHLLNSRQPVDRA